MSGRINTTSAFAFGSQTVSSTALTLEAFTAFTQAQVDRANRVILTVEAQSIRYRYDGTAPTDTVGHLLTAGSRLELVGNDNIQNLQVIRVTTDSTVMVTLEE